MIDYVFDETTSTPKIYEKLASKIVWSAMNGFNGNIVVRDIVDKLTGTIFAYGQTASGKTYTMKGEGKKMPGIIPIAIQEIFNFIKETNNREFLLRVSYLEIYNEIINDLLAPENVNLKIHEDKKVKRFQMPAHILNRKGYLLEESRRKL